jgi:acetyltransferase-like isoleucine patch superfamily enzyme
MLDTPVRKIRSFLLIAKRRLASRCRICVARCMNGEALIPWSTSMGAGVIIQITDGARLHLGERVVIGAGTVISAKYGKVAIGDDVHISPGCVIVAKFGISVGKQTLIGEYVTIRDHDHCIDEVETIIDATFVGGVINIGAGSWLGAKVTVLRDTRIGEGAVIGAHALVKGAIPDRAIAVGIPARVKRFRRKVGDPVRDGVTE